MSCKAPPRSTITTLLIVIFQWLFENNVNNKMMFDVPLHTRRLFSSLVYFWSIRDCVIFSAQFFIKKLFTVTSLKCEILTNEYINIGWELLNVVGRGKFAITEPLIENVWYFCDVFSLFWWKFRTNDLNF